MTFKLLKTLAFIDFCKLSFGSSSSIDRHSSEAVREILLTFRTAFIVVLSVVFGFVFIGLIIRVAVAC